MANKIDRDRKKFIDIVKGKIKGDLRKYFKPGRVVIPRKKGDAVAIPMPKIDLPTFRYGKNKGGVGQGEGGSGTDLGPIEKQPGEGEKKAGEGHGSEIWVEFTQEEIMEILQAQLPRIQPKGEKMIESDEYKYTAVRKVGPESLRHKKRTYKKALKRQMAAGEYNPDDPKIIPIREDKRYKSWKYIERPQNNAVIIFIRDISGSMGQEECEIVSYICFCSELWLRYFYDELDTAYIVHDTIAKTVPTQEEFLKLYYGGGTLISTAHLEALRLIREKYPPELWNIYLMYFSDGFNWGEDDETVMKIIKNDLLPIANQYAYGEITLGRWWWGEKAKETGEFSEPGRFGYNLSKTFGGKEEKAVWAELTKAEDAFSAFKKFYGKGN